MVAVHSPRPLQAQSRDPILHLHPPHLFRRHQAPHIFHINRSFFVPSSIPLDPGVQAPSEDLAIYQKVERHRRRILEHLVNQLRELEPFPLCGNKVGGRGDCISWRASDEIDGELSRSTIGYSGRWTRTSYFPSSRGLSCRHVVGLALRPRMEVDRHESIWSEILPGERVVATEQPWESNLQGSWPGGSGLARYRPSRAIPCKLKMESSCLPLHAQMDLHQRGRRRGTAI